MPNKMVADLPVMTVEFYIEETEDGHRVGTVHFDIPPAVAASTTFPLNCEFTANSLTTAVYSWGNFGVLVAQSVERARQEYLAAHPLDQGRAGEGGPARGERAPSSPLALVGGGATMLNCATNGIAPVCTHDGGCYGKG